MKASTKTLLYVLGGATVIIGGGTAIYLATRDEKKTVVKAPPAPAIPISDVQSTPGPTPEVLTQADILQQQQNQQQQQPKPPPPSIQLLQNLSQII